MSSTISRSNPSPFPNLNQPRVARLAHRRACEACSVQVTTNRECKMKKTCLVLPRQDSSWPPLSFHITFCGQPAQRNLRETLCCRKRIIQSPMPCPVATKTEATSHPVWSVWRRSKINKHRGSIQLVNKVNTSHVSVGALGVCRQSGFWPRH